MIKRKVIHQGGGVYSVGGTLIHVDNIDVFNIDDERIALERLEILERHAFEATDDGVRAKFDRKADKLRRRISARWSPEIRRSLDRAQNQINQWRGMVQKISVMVMERVPIGERGLRSLASQYLIAIDRTAAPRGTDDDNDSEGPDAAGPADRTRPDL